MLVVEAVKLWLSPFREVLLADGAAAELGGKDSFGFGQGVEPLEERGGGFIVLQTAVDLLADDAREAADFS